MWGTELVPPNKKHKKFLKFFYILKCVKSRHENTCAGVSFLTELHARNSCEFCTVSKNTYFSEHLRKAVSVFFSPRSYFRLFLACM